MVDTWDEVITDDEDDDNNNNNSINKVKSKSTSKELNKTSVEKKREQKKTNSTDLKVLKSERVMEATKESTKIYKRKCCECHQGWNTQ